MRLVSKVLSQDLGANMEQNWVLGKRILLVDDQEGVRKAVRFLLELDGHKISEARNGREAFDLFRPKEFDLVITDYLMPEMPGDELAGRIREIAPAQPILMITAYHREYGKLENSVDSVLSKPFSFRDLRAAMSKLLPCVETAGGSEPTNVTALQSAA